MNLLIDMLQELVAPDSQLSPAVFYVDSEISGTVTRLPSEWRINTVDAAAFASEVSQALNEGPVVTFPPWSGRREDRRTPAGDALLAVEPANGNALIAVLPGSTLVSPSAKALRTELFARWRPTLVAYTQGVIEGSHPAFHTAVLRMIPIGDDGPPFRMFEAPPDWRSSHSRVLDDFKRLLRVGGGQTEFGYVLRDPPPSGTPLGFQQNDPRIRRRIEELEQFGRAEYLDHLFEIFQSRSHGRDLGNQSLTRLVRADW